MNEKKSPGGNSEIEVETVALAGDGAPETRRMSATRADEAVPAIASEAAAEKARILYSHVGHLLYPTYEQWESCLRRDAGRMGLAIWETVAAVHEKYVRQHPDADAKGVLSNLIALSGEGAVEVETGETRELRRLLSTAWLNRKRK
jgi:hypothetical protein